MDAPTAIWEPNSGSSDSLFSISACAFPAGSRMNYVWELHLWMNDIMSDSSMLRPSQASISLTYIFVVAGKNFIILKKM